jgi:hypothetical protein
MSQNLGTIYAELGVDTSKMDKGFKQGYNTLKRETSKMERKMKSVSRNMTKIGAGMTAAITAPIVMMGKKMFDAASDAEQVQSRYEIVFGNLTNEANEFVNRMGKMGWNETGIKDDLSNFQKMLKSMGLETDNAFEMSKAMSQLTIDIASFEDISKDVAQQKIVSGVIAGEIEPLRRLGYSLTQARIKREAVKKGIIEEGEAMTEKQKIMTRMMLLMSDAESSQNDFKRTINQTSNQVKILKEQWQKFKELYGEQIQDAFHPLVVSAKELLIWLNGLDEGTRTWIIRMTALVGAVGPVVLILGQFINSLLIIKGAMVAISGSAVMGKLMVGLKGLAGLLSGGVATSIGIFGAGLAYMISGLIKAKKHTDLLNQSVNDLSTTKALQEKLEAEIQERKKLEELVNRKGLFVDNSFAQERLDSTNQRIEETRKKIEELNKMKVENKDTVNGNFGIANLNNTNNNEDTSDGNFNYAAKIEEFRRQVEEWKKEGEKELQKTEEEANNSVNEGTQKTRENINTTTELLKLKAQTIQETFQNIKTSMVDSLTTGMTAIVDGTKSAGDAIRSTFIDIISSLKNMIIKFVAQKAVTTFLNFLAPGVGSIAGALFGGIFHDGGQVPGYNNQDVPIIAQAGEYVLQPEQLNSLLAQAGQTNNNQNSYTINVGDINNYGEEKVSDSVVNEIMRKLRMNEMSTGRLV